MFRFQFNITDNNHIILFKLIPIITVNRYMTIEKFKNFLIKYIKELIDILKMFNGIPIG